MAPQRVNVTLTHIVALALVALVALPATVDAVCCKRKPNFGCCGNGPFNFFCCNCDNGCNQACESTNCDSIEWLKCGAVVAACAATCLGGPEACIACFAAKGVPECIKCYTGKVSRHHKLVTVANILPSLPFEAPLSCTTPAVSPPSLVPIPLAASSGLELEVLNLALLCAGLPRPYGSPHGAQRL